MDRPRENALQILCRVEEGAFADPLLDKSREQFGPRDSAFILELVYGVLRNRSRLDWILDRFSAEPVSKTDLQTRNILRLGAYQMLFLDRVPVSAAVNTATELSKQSGGKSGYVNGLLRNLDRKKASLPEPAADDAVRTLSIRHSHPEWLVRRWFSRFGTETTESILSGNNHPSKLVIRTNLLRTSRSGLRSSLEAAGVRAADTVYAPAALELLSSPGLRSLAPFRDGLFLVQDEAAQLVGLLTAPRSGETVLDACAAPGGKATHLAELMNNSGAIVALESDRERIGRIRENADRLGISIIRPVAGDAARYREGSYDKILIDAPCSGLGVLRRHPDGRWNKKERAISERAALQRSILENCASLLRPNGAVVYATCTTEPEENENMIDWFLSGPGAQFMIDDPRPFLPLPAQRLVDARGFFRTFPHEQGMDGFFGARLIRK